MDPVTGNEEWVPTEALRHPNTPPLYYLLNDFPDVNLYRTWRFLGGGAVGRVFAGFHGGLGRVEAVKRMELPDKRLHDMALAEARLMAQLPPHPHLVSVYNARENHDAIFVTMQFLAGKPLHKQELPVPIEKALAWTREVCEALSMVHANGVIHRDIKPANVFCTPEGRAVLGDFGVARPIGSRTGDAAIAGTPAYMPGGVAGTPAYMPPESFIGRPVPASDIWAIGVMLYELLTGRRPFSQCEDLPLNQIAPALERAELVLPSLLRPEVPGRVDELVAEMLAIRPENRLPGPMDVIDKLPRYRTVVSAIDADITQLQTDAVVVAANDLMAMNVPGSSANAILTAGGTTIFEEAQSRRPVQMGDCVVTTAGLMLARHVLHAVIIHADERGILQPIQERDMRRALWKCMRKAHELRLQTIAFPAMGMRLGGLTAEESARMMIDVVHTYLIEFRPPLQRITFALRDKMVMLAYREAALERGMILV